MTLHALIMVLNYSDDMHMTPLQLGLTSEEAPILRFSQQMGRHPQ